MIRMAKTQEENAYTKEDIKAIRRRFTEEQQAAFLEAFKEILRDEAAEFKKKHRIRGLFPPFETDVRYIALKEVLRESVIVELKTGEVRHDSIPNVKKLGIKEKEILPAR
jgi:hypothetical protein